MRAGGRSVRMNNRGGTAGQSVSYRFIVSNFDAAFRVVTANLGIGVIPVEVGGPIASRLGIKMIP